MIVVGIVLIALASLSSVARSTVVSTGSDSLPVRHGDQSMANSSGLTVGQLGGDLAGVELVAVGVDQRLARRRRRARPAATSCVGVQLARGLVRADVLVHQRLRRRRFVGLVVAMAAVADQVDDDVLAEPLAEVEGELGAEHHRFGVVAVHVQHRRADHLGRRRCSTASSARRRRRWW